MSCLSFGRAAFRLSIKDFAEKSKAGLDYWDKLDVTVYNDYEDFLNRNPGAKIYMATTKAHHTYADVKYEDDCYIMFGKESAGIPEDILVDHEDTCIRIPMIGDIRSLNLSNSVAIVAYEALCNPTVSAFSPNGRRMTASIA